MDRNHAFIPDRSAGRQRKLAVLAVTLAFLAAVAGVALANSMGLTPKQVLGVAGGLGMLTLLTLGIAFNDR